MQITGIMIPGNVVGMILLFLFLMTGIIRLDWVEQASKLLLNHLAFLFIPITVGLMAWGNLFRSDGLQMMVILAISTVAALIATGLMAQGMMNWQQSRAEKKGKQTALFQHEEHGIDGGEHD